MNGSRIRCRHVTNYTTMHVVKMDLHMTDDIMDDSEVSELRRAIIPELVQCIAIRIEDSENRQELLKLITEYTIVLHC